MNVKELDQAIFQAILEGLADQVVERLRTRRKTALALFTGTDLGLHQATASIQALRQEGWVLRLVFSAGARSLLTPECLRELEAGTSPAQTAGAEPDVDALLAGCGRVLVPALSINAAAKVACGVRDCLESRLLARALEQGLTVIAATDGCCPDNPERASGGFLVTDAYRARLRSNLEALRSYGVRLVRAGALADAARGTASPRVEPTPAVMVRATASTWQTGASRIKGEKRPIFSRSDAVQCREGELRLDRDVLVTPLAADELHLRNVHLIQR